MYNPGKVSTMKSTRWITTVSLVAAFALAVPVCALDFPLTDTSIRDAFLTGNNHNDRSNELFAKYTHNFSFRDGLSGPYISKISIVTPYEQVAERGATAANYHSGEAEQEFFGKQLSFLVRIQVQFTQSYPAYAAPDVGGAHSLLQPLPDIQNDFQIDVSQDKTITPKTTREYMVNSYFSNTVWGNAGIVIEEAFDPSQIGSSQMTIDVRAPGDQDVATTFDLTELR